MTKIDITSWLIPGDRNFMIKYLVMMSHKYEILIKMFEIKPTKGGKYT